jgi:WD40 repeat protein
MVTGQEIVQMKLGGKNPSKDITAKPRIYWMSQSEENNVNSIAFSPDGKFIVSGSADNTVRIWNVATGKEIARMLPDYFALTQNGTTYYMSGVYHVAFSPDGKYIASSGTDGNVYIWEVSSGREIARLSPLLKHDISPYLSYSALSVAFSPDSKYVVSGSTDKTIRIWEIKTQREVASFGFFGGEAVSPSGVNSVAFSPDGRYIVWGSDITVHVWDTISKQEILRMSHDHIMYSMDGGPYAPEDNGRSSLGTVNSVAYSRDGKHILSASDDNTVRIWNASTGQEISRIVHYAYSYSSASVRSIAISPDGKYVVSGDSHGQINLWLWRPDDLIADACSRLSRNLTRAEWSTYIGDMLPYQAVCPNLPIK